MHVDGQVVAGAGHRCGYSEQSACGKGIKKKRQVRTLAIDIRLDIPTSQT